jgi:hypothetical protein
VDHLLISVVFWVMWSVVCANIPQEDGPVEMPLPSCRVEPFMNGNHESLGRLESQTGQGRVPKRTVGSVGCGSDEDFFPTLG